MFVGMKLSTALLLTGGIIFIVGIEIYFTGFSGTIATPKSTGIFLIFVSVFLFIYGVIRKLTLDEENRSLMVCSDCGKQYKAKNVSIYICPKCNGKLEELKIE